MLPIPGTSSVEHLEENVAAAELELTADELARLDTATASEPGAGSSPLAELGRR
jgi:aryl-alcohol dehydrogenase-like predicted oxidoreductase